MNSDLQVFNRGAVVVVKARDCTIEFTPAQARNFAEGLTHYAAEAEACARPAAKEPAAL